ncbi:hypothetical protein TrVGV298_003515 [Trichoderma virens]|nr:hypothetical protein TrVGV298_003515 [Trichoderma virens]
MIAARHLLRVFLTLVSLFASHGLSNTIAVNQECVSAVFGIIGGLNFEGVGYGNYYLGLCTNPLKTISVYANSKTYCPPADLEPGFSYFGWACQEYGGAEPISQADLAANLTIEAIKGFPVLDQADSNPLINLTTPILITRDWFDLGFRTEACFSPDSWDYEARTHRAYGFAMYGFWGGVILIGTLHRLISVINERRLPPSSTDPEDTGRADSRENHTSIFDGQYDPYLWPLVAIWSFDRFLRIVRVVYCNLHVQLHKKSLNRSIAAISYDQDANIIRVQINTHIKPRPGQHYYLYQPFRLTGWESHPFTLAYWSQSTESQHRGQAGAPATGSTTVGSIAASSKAMEGEYLMSFWIRPQDGWTRHLRDLCLKSSQVPATSKETILLEGPYGMSEPLQKFDEVLLIAGGSGIAAMVPYVLDYISQASNKSSRTRIRGLTLVWSDRNRAFMHQIAQQELAAALTLNEIRCMFYCTDSAKVSIDATDKIPIGDADKVSAESGVLKSKEETDISESTDSISATGSLTIDTGRPDIPTIIERAATAATESGSRLAVMTCGPAGMSDAARDATYRAIRTRNSSIEYFESAFGW